MKNEIIKELSRESGIPVGLTGGNPSIDDITNFVELIIDRVFIIAYKEIEFEPQNDYVMYKIESKVRAFFGVES